MLHSSLEENCPTKSVYQLFTRTFLQNVAVFMWCFFCSDMTLAGRTRQSCLKHPAASWHEILRYKRFWSKLLLGTRQDNLNLMALYPKRMPSIGIILFPETRNSVFANFMFTKPGVQFKQEHLRFLSLLTAISFTCLSLSAAC